MNIVYLNGEYIPADQAKISIMDRSVLFGDSLYEVIPVYEGYLVGEKQHIARLHQGEQATQIPSPLSADQWHDVFEQLLTRNKATENNHSIYLQVSRGTETKRLHAWQTDTQPTVFAYVTELPPIDMEAYKKGKKVITQIDIRRETCFIKSTALQVNTIMQHQAKEAGAAEVILFRDGKLTEGSTSNVFIVKNNTLFTHPANEHILNGVTRRIVIECAQKNGITVEECLLDKQQVCDADEVWLSSSTKEVCPIVQVDDQTIGSGKAGPLWGKMIQYYRQTIMEGSRV
ncbi:MAG: aminotransferase class IV [Coxiellaceae bacterium]|nr:aminotransferase class IV [Coxiellaceae bacterium]